MIIELLFIAAVGYLILWCGTHGDPRAGLRQLLHWRPSRPVPFRRQTRGPVPHDMTPPAPATGSEPAGTPTATSPTTPEIEQVHTADALIEARWNALIADLDDLADLDLDPD